MHRWSSFIVNGALQVYVCMYVCMYVLTLTPGVTK